ncbi:MAG: class I SAM-dependent methyltransferase [Fuerstiella sp.]
MPLFQIATSLIGLAESARLPDAAIRFGMRQLLGQRLKQISSGSLESRSQSLTELLKALCESPVAQLTDKANEQHYEVPSQFFKASLGSHLKYSCCYWDDSTNDLDTAERNALQRTCVTAGLQNGQDILELGCGWGSLSLWMAEQYPDSNILAVSNSQSQKVFIDQQAQLKGLTNLTVQTCDVNIFEPARTFDRVVSVEMFEHVRNHGKLMERIAGWLKANGKLFVHIFCHDRETYLFEDQEASNWMTRHFFSGGIMPGRDLLLRYQQHLTLETQVCWDGTHYEKTANAWLKKMDQNRELIKPCFRETYAADWKIWIQRWRMFYMACAELFGYHKGSEWYVSHYLFTRKSF